MSAGPPAHATMPATTQASAHAVALVGIGCRFPGGVVDPAGFWQLLLDGRDVVGDIPAARIDIGGFFDERPATPGRIMSRRGGYLEGIESFDAAFFGISPREAERLDPQQRLLLETAWEALEDAGIDVASLHGSATGVYVGQWISDFESRLFTDAEGVDFLMTTGSGRYAASGRVSYALGLRGPSLTLDTACSSSLAAVHLALRAVRSGECRVALAGGANVILQPHIHVAYSQSRMMAPDGQCKFGDARGDGYVRSEGAALVVLKRLEDALAAGDRIYAVLHGSAVNNDGDSSGSLGTPSRLGQQELLRAAYRDAGMPPSAVGYVEAHGTGTRAGDPVELGALAAVLGEGRASERPALVGSVKTNLGHTEGAAGVAGLVKAALAVHHGRIPRSLHLQELNPAIDWARFPLRIASAGGDWPAPDEAQGASALAGARLAGVSAFGIAGTNAHVVLGAAPAPELPRTAASEGPAVLQPVPRRPALLVLSARSPEALRALAARYVPLIRQRIQPLIQPPHGAPREALDDLCWAAATRRTALPCRAAFVAEEAAALVTQLEAFAAGEAADGETGASAGLEGTVLPAPSDAAAGTPWPPPPVFVVPGQGGQWPGMARDLLAREPVFRDALRACDVAARPWLPPATGSIERQLGLDPGHANYALDRIELIQPTLVALAIAYARWLQAVGITPGALVGHSMGEVGAAHLAGVLDLDTAMRIVCRRSQLMSATRGQGGMAVVGLPMAELESRLRASPGRATLLSVAASNGPASSVVSGDAAALAAFIAELDTAGVFARAVQVDVASHSPQMEGPAAALAAELKGDPVWAPHAATVPIHSTVLARRASGEEFDAGYWGRNLRQPVRFEPCVAQLWREGARSFVELGPHPVLSGAVQQTVESLRAGAEGAGAPAAALACGRRDEAGPAAQASLMALVGLLWTRGHAVDWAALLPRADAHIALPLYPWQRERHWHEAAERRARPGGADHHATGTEPAHPLLQRRVDLAGGDATHRSHVWEGRLDLRHLPYLGDHRVRGSIIFPAAAYCDLALAAAADSRAASRYALRDVEFHAAWALPSIDEQVGADRPVASVQVRLQWQGDGGRFEIHGRTRIESAAVAGGPHEDHGHGAHEAAPADAEEGAWTLRASGRLVPSRDESPPDLPPWSPQTRTGALAPGEPQADAIYAAFGQVGLAYGPAFRGLDALHTDDGTCAPADNGSGPVTRAELALDPDSIDRTAARHRLYPPLLDAVLQVHAAALAASREGTPVPVRLGTVTLHGAWPAQGTFIAQMRTPDRRRPEHADIDVFDTSGRCLATLRGSVIERLGAPARRRRLDDLLFQGAWVTLPPQAAPAPTSASTLAAGPSSPVGPPVLLVVPGLSPAEPSGLAEELAAWSRQLEAAGHAVTTIDGDALAGTSDAPNTAPAAQALPALQAWQEQAARLGVRGHVVHLGALACPPAEGGDGWIELAWHLACDSALALAQVLETMPGEAALRVWLVTRGAVMTGHEDAAGPDAARDTASDTGCDVTPPDQVPGLAAAPLWGLGRSWAHEQPALDVTLVDLQARLAELTPLLAAPAGDAPSERQWAHRRGRWLGLRLHKTPVAETVRAAAAVPAFAAALGTPGAPGSLHWQATQAPAPRADEVEVEVEHAGLNFMNLMSVLGIYPGYEHGQGPLGIECSGRVRRVGAEVSGFAPGDAVVAIGHGCLQSHARVAGELVAKRPRALEGAAAAGTPIAFLTAAYGLSHLARLAAGERVLVHSAAGGVGLAALQIARRLGAEVLATAGTEEKRVLLRSMGVAHVFDSRTGGFAEAVLAATGGRGVDVVLNSLAGEAAAEGLRCLAPYGRFVELGKRDIHGGGALALAPFRANLAYFAVDLDGMMRERPAVLGPLLRELMAGFDDGTYTPLPVRRYAADELETAFRDLMPGTHVGKHVLALAPPPAGVRAAPGLRMTVRADRCYVITGGFGALGMALARWLARRGAGSLMLVGRSQPSPAVQTALLEIEAAGGGLGQRSGAGAGTGTRVLTAHIDVADAAALKGVLERARREGGPLGGVFHAAGVLADGTLGRLDPARLRAPRDAKVFGAWHLHRLTDADALDAFVMLSSVASLFGTPGQGNYAAANAFLDALAAHRRAVGRPALAIQLGPVADVGLAAARAERGSALSRLGFEGITAEQAIEAIDTLVHAGIAQAACADFDPTRWRAQMGRDGLIDLVPPEDETGHAVEGTAEGAAAGARRGRSAAVSLAAELAAAPPGPPRRALLEGAIKAEVAAVLRMAAARVPTDRALKSLGLDSLMALELRNRLEKRAAVALSPTLAWNHPTVQALATHLAERLRLSLNAVAAAASATAQAPAEGTHGSESGESGKPGEGADLDALLDDLENMSEEEARALLDQGAAP